MKPLYKLLTNLSSNKLISRTTGRFAKHRASKVFIHRFAKAYNININEAEKSIHEYESLNEFFTRRLKKEARFINVEEDIVVSPVDAIVTGIGDIRQGTILNVKGQAYTVGDILADPQKAEVYQNGTFIVLYLSPTDYHRIHSPITGTIKEHVHLEGRVYPVNDFSLKNMKQVLSRNERLITYIKNEHTELALIKVGALNVASIQLTDRMRSTKIGKGEEFAYFEFGSTVVLLMKGQSVLLNHNLVVGAKVKMGEEIGRYSYN
ncbi:archaetidylserine decarboxylase [Bacillus horti]|uniref:Phosphatidylserine decarboxylase proenzyme n=1 Tax=Caldalkalibacillus horti TaxID=77523 RepID=A0ABT9VW22_9BACI|nr:archaetidylserine decarboxylase [Bacillus horti]MDQ0165190.1 phosphatidylserine decarboxylase [Bacillus horti]